MEITYRMLGVRPHPVALTSLGALTDSLAQQYRKALGEQSPTSTPEFSGRVDGLVQQIECIAAQIVLHLPSATSDEQNLDALVSILLNHYHEADIAFALSAGVRDADALRTRYVQIGIMEQCTRTIAEILGMWYESVQFAVERGRDPRG